MELLKTGLSRSSRSAISRNDVGPEPCILRRPGRRGTCYRSKTSERKRDSKSWIGYQSKRRCSKTLLLSFCLKYDISYQSKRRCSKTGRTSQERYQGSATSQNDAAPKPRDLAQIVVPDQLPVKTTLLQNRSGWTVLPGRDQLPVKTTLLQNLLRCLASGRQISYQSKRHCSKTVSYSSSDTSAISYQSKRRCSKTGRTSRERSQGSATSQNDAAPKLRLSCRTENMGSATSQNDAAPKRRIHHVGRCGRSATSQNDAAPKPSF